MVLDLVRYSRILEIVGDILKVEVPEAVDGKGPAVRFGDLAVLEGAEGHKSLAQVININRQAVSLQIFTGTKGISTSSTVTFLGHPMRVTYSPNILGRVFDGTGNPIDGGPDLSMDQQVTIGGPSVNPAERIVPTKMIRTDVPMIDIFNCLVESQKIPIFSVSGEPFNPFLARIGIQADADIVVFGGLGLIFDDYFTFRKTFEDAGVFSRTVMIINQASDPIVERLLVPDMALAVAERFAVEEGKRVLVLLTDMTAYADALKEVGISMERVPSNRGYMGDLYSQLARRYEKACDYAKGGSVTILTVTTMPGNDVTHPVPDNTGYITEGQFYLHDGVIDPFGSLSRLKQNVIGKVTREDHSQIMTTMIRFYSGARDAQQKQAMAFDLSDYDEQLLKFGKLFRERFMDIEVSLPLEEALDLSWRTLAECFQPEQLLMKQELIDKYFPKDVAPTVEPEAGADQPSDEDEAGQEAPEAAAADEAVETEPEASPEPAAETEELAAAESEEKGGKSGAAAAQ
ncbi:MAG: V-type ATP synthase subunit B [Kiloniellales bacterium]|nr:V-type ATP synthase subunit B [Kiloniellales bacterium]